MPDVVMPTWLDQLRSACLALESDRGLRPRSLVELDRYLGGFAAHCSSKGLGGPSEITPELMHSFVLERCTGSRPALTKAVVWSLRKLGSYLALNGLVAKDPAGALHHPRIEPRAKLPRFLDAAELRALLETAARHRDVRDLVVLSLMATTGMRPKDVTCLRRGDINLAEQRIDHRTKGGWQKATPLSVSMTSLLEHYLAERDDDEAAAFLTPRGRPMTVGWIQRMVREAGRQAGVESRLTPNILRHTFATHAADRHGTLVTKTLLGHSGLTRSEVYMHLSARRFRALVRLHPYQHAFRLGVANV